MNIDDKMFVNFNKMIFLEMTNISVHGHYIIYIILYIIYNIYNTLAIQFFCNCQSHANNLIDRFKSYQLPDSVGVALSVANHMFGGPAATPDPP